MVEKGRIGNGLKKIELFGKWNYNSCFATSQKFAVSSSQNFKKQKRRHINSQEKTSSLVQTTLSVSSTMVQGLAVPSVLIVR